jgi:hypothetical protein
MPFLTEFSLYRTKQVRPGVWQKQRKRTSLSFWRNDGPEFNAPPVVEANGEVLDKKKKSKQ